MVVDDDMFCSQLVKMMLESIGQTVDLACNGKESIGLYQKNCKGYKMIFMDFHMPESMASKLLNRFVRLKNILDSMCL